MAVNALLTNPWVVQSALTGTAALYSAINPNRAMELQNEVLEGYRQLRQDTARQARGQFTPAEGEQLRAAAQPELQRVSGTVASRGLGTSPAGAQILADAEQSVFSRAQQMATMQQHVVNREAFSVASSLANRDESFIEDLAGTARAIQRLRAMGAEPDPQAVGALESAFGLQGGYLFYDPAAATGGTL